MMNQVQLIGHTGAEPEFRTTSKGKKCVILRVCTNIYTKKDGERTDYPIWHTIEVWKTGTVEWLASKTLPKGSKVFVQGEIRNEQYKDKDGHDRYFSKVVVSLPGQQLQVLERDQFPDDEA